MSTWFICFLPSRAQASLLSARSAGGDAAVGYVLCLPVEFRSHPFVVKDILKGAVQGDGEQSSPPGPPGIDHHLLICAQLAPWTWARDHQGF
jgi:hypothetical protein